MLLADRNLPLNHLLRDAEDLQGFDVALDAFALEILQDLGALVIQHDQPASVVRVLAVGFPVSLQVADAQGPDGR